MNTYIYSINMYNGVHGIMHVHAISRESADRYMLLMLHDTTHFSFEGFVSGK